MKKWCKILLMLVTVACIAGIPTVEAAIEEMNVVKVRSIEGRGKVFIPEIRGIADKNAQTMLNANLKNAILALKNSATNSSLNGDFSVSFYNQNILGIHFIGDSFSPGTAHPNKIDQGFHIDLMSGQIYKLADLFMADADYVNRIKELCATNHEQYRLRIDGLWDGWRHEDFANSWSGVDAAFLLSEKALRVYAIPRYATGAIGGYSVPYADLMDIIDQNSSLWRKLQGQPMMTISVYSDNIIDKARVQVGDVIAGLTVASLELRNGSLVDASFTGEIELNGISEWLDNVGDGAGYVFTVDEAYADCLPIIKGLNVNRSFVLRGKADSQLLPKEKVRAKIIVDSYSIGERQIIRNARLVKIVSLAGPALP